MKKSLAAFTNKIPTHYLAIALPTIIFAVQSILSRTYIYCTRRVSNEDMGVEWLTVLALMIAAIFAIACVLKYWRDRQILFALFFVGVALVAIAGGGEEISWGQRLLGIETPEWVSNNSAQDETNIHNLLERQISLRTEDVLIAVALVYGIILPLVTVKGRVPVPSLFFIPGFVLTAFLLTSPVDIFNSDREWAELAFAILMMLVMIDEWQKTQQERFTFRLRGTAITSVGGVLVTLLLVWGIQGYCQHTYCGSNEADVPVIEALRETIDESTAVVVAHHPSIYGRLFEQCALTGPQIYRPLYPDPSLTLDLDNPLLTGIMDEALTYNRVLAIYDPAAHQDYDPAGQIESRLRTEGYETETLNFPHVQVVGYGIPDALETTTSGAMFGEHIRLEAFDTSATTIKPGDILAVGLHWAALEQPAADYTVGVHLLDESGVLVAQHDAPPHSGTTPTSSWQAGDEILDQHGITLPDDLSPGVYRLYTALYNTEGRLPVTVDDEQADSLLLSEIVIE